MRRQHLSQLLLKILELGAKYLQHRKTVFKGISEVRDVMHEVELGLTKLQQDWKVFSIAHRVLSINWEIHKVLEKATLVKPGLALHILPDTRDRHIHELLQPREDL